MLKIGDINEFIVKRETDISYTLSPKDPELTTYVFLHFNQATRKLIPGEEIKAFLYYDQKKRLCATMEEPLITVEKYGFVEVVDINDKAGVFVNIGISKDILLSADYLPNYHKAWPIVGDKLPCILKNKTDQLVARIINHEDKIKETIKLSKNEEITGIVSKITPEGLGVYTEDYNYVFIHKSLIRKKYRLGEPITLKINHINEKGYYYGTTIAQKEVARIDDSEIILQYLDNFGGVLPLGNASTPEEIAKVLSMSKSAFKRAVGNLYKKRLILIEDHRIIKVNNK